jgi:HSP20 family molecular chaperone IbpA
LPPQRAGYALRMVLAQTQPVPVNVYETSGALVVVAPLPGVMADDIELTLEPGRLTIQAAMRTTAPKDYLMHEWTYGPYERTLEIPEDVGREVSATHGNGQLAVSLAKGAPLPGTQTFQPVHHP